jgi:hypothetical protein
MADQLVQIPTNYYYQGMGFVILILLVVLFLIAITFYFIGRKNEWSYKKRGVTIGLILGIIWLIIAGTGTFICNWNPVEGSVVPSGICKNLILLYVFYLPSLFTLFPPISFSIIGLFVGWIIGKIKSQ